ncbi:MAG TPA: hypothetical protein VLA34_06435, partial [Candidatus Krumholzibacterium sp.]|nr:hypothetical protein [Candidatus Krumholzibacterium sp.]
RDRHLRGSDEYGKGSAIEEIYLSRQPHIEELMRYSEDLVEREGEFEEAVKVVAEILREYSELALKSIDATEDRGPREELIEALSDFYRQLGDSAREALDEIDDRGGREPESVRELYEELLKNARETRRKIERE